MVTSYLLALTIYSSVSVQIRWRRLFSVWSQLHKSSSWSLTYTTSMQQFFQPYSLYCCSVMNSYLLPLCFSVLYPMLFLLKCIVTVFCVQEMKRGSRTECQYCYWKALWYLRSQNAAGFVANIYFFLFLCVYLKWLRYWESGVTIFWKWKHTVLLNVVLRLCLVQKMWHLLSR